MVVEKGVYVCTGITLAPGKQISLATFIIVLQRVFKNLKKAKES